MTCGAMPAKASIGDQMQRRHEEFESPIPRIKKAPDLSGAFVALSGAYRELTSKSIAESSSHEAADYSLKIKRKKCC